MPRTLERWTQGRVPIGVRWWITRSGEFRVGWPSPGLEPDTLAMGWVARHQAIGVLEHPEPPLDLGILDLLEERFPDRRWFAGDWAFTEASLRQAA
jgi:hypothetical protein